MLSNSQHFHNKSVTDEYHTSSTLLLQELRSCEEKLRLQIRWQFLLEIRSSNLNQLNLNGNKRTKEIIVHQSVVSSLILSRAPQGGALRVWMGEIRGKHFLYTHLLHRCFHDFLGKCSDSVPVSFLFTVPCARCSIIPSAHTSLA